MRIAADQIIAGVNARALRDFFKKRQGTQFSREQIAGALPLAHDQAALVTDELLRLGLIAQGKVRLWESEPRYELTTAGGQLAQASFAKRMTRERAEELLRHVVSNASLINADDALTHRVSELRVFGSYLSDAEDLGDLDIAFGLVMRYPNGDLVAMSLRRAEQSGRSNLSFVQSLGYGEAEVTKLLSGGKRGVSLHDLDDLRQLGVEGVRVYPEAA